jgi:hypothetical protein
MMTLLSTTEIKKLTGLAAMTLSFWIARGWVKPARQGGYGRGHSYGFTGQEAFALIVAAGVAKVYGNAGKFIRDNWKLAASVPDDEFREWITGDLSAWTEERNAAERARHGSRPLLPEGQLRDAIYPMLGKFRELMLEKYGIGATGRPLAKAKAAK